ncbi:MAG: ABC-2 family transporter protein [Caldilineaceae bacterium]|nr:ABC-2 family transporter protein [Caldilineaceae bacterium]
MRLFWELGKLSFQRQLSYRAANLAGLATNIFFGLLRASVMIALFGARQQVEGMTIGDAITYTGLTQAVIAYLSIFGWNDLMNSIYSGEVGSDLLKPMGYFRYWLARDLGRAAASLLLRGVTIMVIYALFYRITIPQGALQWLALLTSIVLGLLVSFGWRFIVNLSAFWTPDARGVGRFAFGIAWVLSGFFMPLRFYPDWFIRFCQLTPFPAMVNTTVEVYLGLLSGTDLLLALAVQVGWVLLLALIAQLVLKMGMRHLVIQGG